LQIRYLLVIVVVYASFLLATVSTENYATLATQVNQVETSTITVGSSVTTSLSQPQQLINHAVKVISTTGTNLRCEFWNLTFMGNQGQYVSGNLTSDIPLDFYIVQDTSYQDWLNSGTCGNAGDAIASRLITTAYSFDAVLPSSGKWDIVLVNSSNVRDADGFLSAYLSSGSYTVTGLLLSTVTTTSAPTNVTAPTTSIPGFSVESIAVGIVIGLAALMILRYRRRVRR
jgi:hypothetical protein